MATAHAILGAVFAISKTELFCLIALDRDTLLSRDIIAISKDVLFLTEEHIIFLIAQKCATYPHVLLNNKYFSSMLTTC